VISRRLRLDKGTETGQMAMIHAFLRRNHDDIENVEDTVLYGSSTSNKVHTVVFLLLGCFNDQYVT
jgi:hypothetical protein